ncbi:MAG TPA: HRDC domain-containing protein, partial [Adhaeribacter sp.]|nr:HRDC domain-containing protein [Adhaeribacter sp.]
LLSEYLEKDIENFGVIKITQKGRNFIENPHSFMLSKDHNFDEEVAREEEREETQASSGHDAVLFDLLKGLRKKLAKEKNLPPYVLFQDPSLKEMATTYPTNKEDLAHIAGVGMGKVQKFGKPFLDLISKYVEDNDIETAADVVVKSAVNKSKIKIYIIQQIDKKMDLEEIAASKGITMPELIEEIEHICYSGTKLNLNYYINNVLDDDRQDEVYDYFMNATTDNIQEALKTLGTSDYTEEDLRLMRIKFLSEYAN